MTNTSFLIIAVASSLVSGQTVASRTPPVVKACSLLSKTEVKKLIGATNAFDSVEPKDEPTTNGMGSSCKYAGAFVQVAVSTSPMNGLAGRPGSEAITDLGDQAYISNNPAGAVDVYVRVGSYNLVVERPLEPGLTLATARSAALALAKALAAKLQ